jgi:hypothetical protein
MESPASKARVDALRDLIPHLEMPPTGLRRWFLMSWKACHRHGGPRHYGELLSLYESCFAALGADVDLTAPRKRATGYSREEPPERVSLRMNSLFMVADMAIRALGDPLVEQHRDALILGSLREDVLYIPVAGIVWEHYSFSHFYREGIPGGIIPFLWPGPRFSANRFYRKALALHRAGHVAAGFVQLGRVLHLVTDMVCPVHAHGVVHETDPYEWYVEANKRKLIGLPVPSIPDAATAGDCVHGIARVTQQHPPDRTNVWWGRILKRLGLRSPVPRAQIVEQANVLVPAGAAWAAALLRLYVRDAYGELRSRPPVVVETSALSA